MHDSGSQQNPNDQIYYGGDGANHNGSASYNTGANYWPTDVKVRHGRSTPARIVILLLAAVVPIVMMVLMLKFIIFP